MSRTIWLGFNEVLDIGDPNTGKVIGAFTSANGQVTFSGVQLLQVGSITSIQQGVGAGASNSGLFTWGLGQVVGVSKPTATTYNALLSDFAIMFGPTASGVCNILSPINSGLHIFVKNVSANSSNFTVKSPVGNIDQFPGTFGVQLAKWDCLQLVADGTNWNIIGVRPATLGL